MKPLCRNLSVLALFLLLQLFYNSNLSAQNIAVNSTGNAPDSSAILDIQSSSKGLLIPRVSLTALNAAAPLNNPAQSLLVYNTNSAIDGGAGYYYNSGTPGSPNWVKLVGSDTATYVIDDMRVPLDKGSNSAALGTLSGISGPEIYFFRDGQGVEAMSFTMQLPHNWKEGTTIFPHVHWVPKNSGSGNIKWNLDYSWADLDEGSPQAFPAITTTSVVVNGPFTQNQHLISPLTTGNVGISGAGKHYSSILICRIWRNSGDTSDTYQADAGGLSVDFHIMLKNVFR